jgi:hypothetical protein
MKNLITQAVAEFLRGFFPHTSIHKLRVICKEHGMDIHDLALLFINLCTNINDRNYDVFGFIENNWANANLQFVNGLCALAIECCPISRHVFYDLIYLLPHINADVKNSIAVDCNLWDIKKQSNRLSKSHDILLSWNIQNNYEKPFWGTLCKYGFCKVDRDTLKNICNGYKMAPFNYYANTYKNMCETDEFAMQNRYLAIPCDAKIHEYCKNKNAVMSHLEMLCNRMRMLFIMEIEESIHGGNVLLADIFIVKTICKYFWMVDGN